MENNTLEESDATLVSVENNSTTENNVNYQQTHIIPNKILSPYEIMIASSKTTIPLIINFSIIGITNFGTALLFANQSANILAASPYLFALQTLPAITGAAVHGLVSNAAILYGEFEAALKDECTEKLSKQPSINSIISTANDVQTIGIVSTENNNNQQALIPKSISTQKLEILSSILRNGQILSLCLGLPPMLLIWYIKPLIVFIGCPETIADIVQDYAHVWIGCVPLNQLALGSKLFLESTNKAKATVVSDLLGGIVLLSVGYLLSYGPFGLPNLGVKGLAYGSIFQFGTIVLLNEFSLFRERHRYSLYKITESLKSRWDAIKRIWLTGYPFIFLATSQITANYIMLIMVTQFGAVALSAQNIATHYKMFIGIPMLSLSQSTAILLGQAFGAKSYLAMRSLYDAGVSLSLLYSAIALAIFTLIPNLLTSLFVFAQPDENSTALDQTLRPLYITAFLNLMEDAVLISSFASLRGLGKTKISSAIGLGTRWFLNLPLAALFGFVFNLGVVGLMIGEDIGLFIGTVIMTGYWMDTINKVFAENLISHDLESVSYFPAATKIVKQLSSAILTKCGVFKCGNTTNSQNEHNNDSQTFCIPFS